MGKNRDENALQENWQVATVSFDRLQRFKPPQISSREGFASVAETCVVRLYRDGS